MDPYNRPALGKIENFYSARVGVPGPVHNGLLISLLTSRSLLSHSARDKRKPNTVQETRAG